MLGIEIRKEIGVGDALQFSSLPENYYRATGKKLLDVSKPWFFDHNPYVTRTVSFVPSKTLQLWNFGHADKYEWPRPRAEVYLSNAEIHAAVLGVPVVLNRPRLYKYEDTPFEKRSAILLQTRGISHGTMPKHVIDHVVKKYKPTGRLYHIGTPNPEVNLPQITTPTLWDLARVISEASLFIGVDSGPGWIAACYPDVTLKILRTKPTPDIFKSWVPLQIQNIHSHWDDRCRQVFNPSEDDCGFTYSYRRL